MKISMNKMTKKQNKDINGQKTQGNQLQMLLKTNKILISNKKSIYQTKITTYERQMQKITNLLNANLSKNKKREEKLEDSHVEDQDQQEQEEDNQEEDLEEREALVEKLKSIEAKKEEAVAKLLAIDAIEKDIKMEQEQKNLKATKKVNSLESDKQNKSIEQLKINKQKLRQSSMNRKMPEKQQKQWRIRQKQAKTISINTVVNKTNTFGELFQKQQDKADRKRISQPVNVNFGMKDRRQEQNSNSYLLDSQNKQQFMLWTQNQQQSQYQDQNQDQSSQIHEFTMKSNKKNSRKSLHKQKSPINPHEHKRRSGKSLYLTSTPISITKDQHKQPTNAQSILEQQYLIILEQIFNIVDTINQIQYPDQSGKRKQQRIAKIGISPQIDQNAGIKSLFRCTYQYLLKIREAIKQNNVTLENLLIQNKKWEQFQKIQRQKQKQEYLRQKQNKKQQKQLNSMVSKLKEEQNKISEELMSIQNQCQIYCAKIEERQKYYWDIMKKIEEGESCRKEIEGNMGDVMKMYETNMAAIEKQLREIYEGISRTERQSTSRSSTNPKKKQLIQNPPFKLAKISQKQNVVEHKISNISQMHEYIRSTIQAQKMTVLQNKQSILSLEYQIGLLKGDEKRLQTKCQQMLDKIQKLTIQSEENNKQVAKSTKQREKMTKIMQSLTKDCEQYENLLAIKKNGYEELDNKYNTLKSKKNKIQKSLKDIEAELQQKQIKSQKLDEYLEKRQQILENINQEVRSKLREKQQIIKDIELSDNLAVQKQNHIKRIEELIEKKQEYLKKVEKKLNQLEANIQKLKDLELKKNASIDKKQEEFKEQVTLFNQKSASLQKIMADLSDQEAIYNQKERRIKEFQKQIQSKQNLLNQQKQQYKELSSKLISAQQEIKTLEQVKQSLEQTIGVLLQKKQQAIQYIGSKYEELQKMDASIQEVCLDLQEKLQVRQQKLKQIEDLEGEIVKLDNQRIRLNKQNKKNADKLQNTLAMLEQNRDEEQNLQQRIKKYKQIQSKLLLQIAVRVFSEQQDSDNIQPHLSSLLPIQTKQQIEFQLEQLKQVRRIKQLYEKQKQENRRLKFDNERLKKLYQMDMHVDIDCSGSVVRSGSRNQSYSSSRVK